MYEILTLTAKLVSDSKLRPCNPQCHQISKNTLGFSDFEKITCLPSWTIKLKHYICYKKLVQYTLDSKLESKQVVTCTRQSYLLSQHDSRRISLMTKCSTDSFDHTSHITMVASLQSNKIYPEISQHKRSLNDNITCTYFMMYSLTILSSSVLK